MKRNLGPTIIPADDGKFKVIEMVNGVKTIIVEDCPFSDLDIENKSCNLVCPLKNKSNGKCTMINPTVNYVNLRY